MWDKRRAAEGSQFGFGENHVCALGVMKSKKTLLPSRRPYFHVVCCAREMINHFLESNPRVLIIGVIFMFP